MIYATGESLATVRHAASQGGTEGTPYVDIVRTPFQASKLYGTYRQQPTEPIFAKLKGQLEQKSTYSRVFYVTSVFTFFVCLFAVSWRRKHVASITKLDLVSLTFLSSIRNSTIYAHKVSQ